MSRLGRVRPRRFALLTFGALLALLVSSGGWVDDSRVEAAPVKDKDLLKAEAFVHRRCSSYAVIHAGQWMSGWKFNALFGNCRAGDGMDQHIWFFSGGHFIGSDTRESDPSKGIIGLWRTGDTIAFMYVLYRPRDPNCCATGGGKIVRFRLEGDHVKRIDPLPSLGR